MVSRRLVYLTSILAIAVSCFTLGVIHARRTDALVARAYDAVVAVPSRRECMTPSVKKEIAVARMAVTKTSRREIIRDSKFGG